MCLHRSRPFIRGALGRARYALRLGSDNPEGPHLTTMKRENETPSEETNLTQNSIEALLSEVMSWSKEQRVPSL